MKILDATAANRSIWYQKHNPFTVFLDKRKGNEYFDFSINGKKKAQIIKISPDIQATWQNLPLKSDSFDMVVFDPPHIIRKSNGTGGMNKKYGVLLLDTWKQDIRDGVNELFRALKEDGIFIFKWNEINVLVDEPLKLFPYKPLFGTRTGQKNNTHWILFIKYREEKQLSDF